MNTRLIIARHGNTFGPGDVVRRVGTTDLPLVDSGLLQGRQLGLWLQENHFVPDHIVTSTLQRTIQTAEQAQLAMGTDLPVETLSLFNEIDYGQDENKAEQDVIERLGAAALEEWENQALVPDGWQVDPAVIIQNWLDFAEQIRHAYTGKTVLLITSNGIARFSPHITGDFSAFAAKHRIKIATGAACVFEHHPPARTWRCLQWNVKKI